MKTVHLQSVGRSVRRSSTLFSIPISLHRAINLPSVCQIKAYWDWNLILQLVKLSSSATAEDHQHLIHYFVHLSGQLQHQLLLCKGTLAVRERNSGLVARSQNGHPCFSEFCLWFSEWLWTNLYRLYFPSVCIVDIYSEMSSSTVDMSFWSCSNFSQSWKSLANLLLRLLDSAVQPKPKFRWQLSAHLKFLQCLWWFTTLLCTSSHVTCLCPYDIFISLYACTCMYVNEDKLVSSQSLPSPARWLHAPVMAASLWVCMSLPLAGSRRQGFLDAPILPPAVLGQGHCLCQLQCSNLVPTTYLFSREHRLGVATAAEFECQSWCNEEFADKPHKHTGVLQ